MAEPPDEGRVISDAEETETIDTDRALAPQQPHKDEEQHHEHEQAAERNEDEDESAHPAAENSIVNVPSEKVGENNIVDQHQKNISDGAASPQQNLSNPSMAPVAYAQPPYLHPHHAQAPPNQPLPPPTTYPIGIGPFPLQQQQNNVDGSFSAIAAPPPPAHQAAAAAAMMYYEARMRDHAAAYASAAWAAAQVASQAADSYSCSSATVPAGQGPSGFTASTKNVDAAVAGETTTEENDASSTTVADINVPQHAQGPSFVAPWGSHFPSHLPPPMVDSNYGAANGLYPPWALLSPHPQSPATGEHLYTGMNGPGSSCFSDPYSQRYPIPQLNGLLVPSRAPLMPYITAHTTQHTDQGEDPNTDPTKGPQEHNDMQNTRTNERSTTQKKGGPDRDRGPVGRPTTTDNSGQRRKRQQHHQLPDDDPSNALGTRSTGQSEQPSCKQHRTKQPRPPQQQSHQSVQKTGHSQQQQQSRGIVRRRFLRSDNDSNSSSGSSFMTGGRGAGNNNNNNGGRSSKRRGYSHNKKKKARPDESLLGKTGVSALYEWCSKRDKAPVFTLNQSETTEEFDCTVCLDDDKLDKTGVKEWGKGRGLNKTAAKQEAARRALQALLPGVGFDENTGILVTLPIETLNFVRSNMDDLAPHLAKRLAIGQGVNSITNSSRISKLPQPKRSLGVYPDASTTSDDEGENPSLYYASRGASVCSQLLHAIIQIDSARIPEAPLFSYEVNPMVLPCSMSQDTAQKFSRGKHTSSGPSSKRRIVNDKNVVAELDGMVRGSFTCTAQLKVISSAVARRPIADKKNAELVDELKTEEILTAVAVGSNKREARHVASAKLLALLFPECSDMAHVKEAAEAMRERYAATKARKQLAAVHASKEHDQPLADTAIGKAHCLSSSRTTNEDPGCNSSYVRRRRASGDLEDELVMSVSAVALSETVENANVTRKAFAPRSPRQQKQIDCLVDSVLQIVNDDGRSLPEELTVDDVGLFRLRRAEPEDCKWMKNLFQAINENDRAESLASRFFSNSDSPKCDQAALCYPEDALHKHNSMYECEAIRRQREDRFDNSLFSEPGPPSTVVLLLCRAIAAYEDPPLGCAILSLEFSVDEGRILRLARIASEPHLPQERFVDCLWKFAKEMGCTLQPVASASSYDEESHDVLSTDDIIAIVKSHILNDEKPAVHSTEIGKAAPSVLPEFQNSSTLHLQSVQEESELSEESASMDRRLDKRTSKPSKRSRFT